MESKIYTVLINKSYRYSWMLKVNTLLEASIACRAFIKKKCLRSHDFAGGEVFDSTHKMVNKVSYNGRVWDMEGYEIRIDDAPLAEELFPSSTVPRPRHPPKVIPFPTEHVYRTLDQYLNT